MAFESRLIDLDFNLRDKVATSITLRTGPLDWI